MRYKRQYARLYGTAFDALDALEKDNVPLAIQILYVALHEAEEAYVSEPPFPAKGSKRRGAPRSKRLRRHEDGTNRPPRVPAEAGSVLLTSSGAA